MELWVRDVVLPGLDAALARRGLTAVDEPAPGRLALVGTLPLRNPPSLVVAELRDAIGAGPLMMVTRSPAEEACVAWLDAGADDCAGPDASPDLFAARLHALGRRIAPSIALGELSIDPVERRVTRCGRAIELLPREFALLMHLTVNADRVVQRSALWAAVWGLHFDPGTNVLEVHVSRLRAKLDRGFGAPMLLTERGSGYRLVAGGAAAV